MTVSDYRSRVGELTDTGEYMELLERFSKSETLYGLRDTDETAAFLFYVLEPLTAEKWKSRDYSGCASSVFSCPEDNAMLASIQIDTDDLIERLQTEKLVISIEYAYFPLFASDEHNGSGAFEDTGWNEMGRHFTMAQNRFCLV